MRTIALSAAAVVALAGHACGQVFTNGDFSSGDLTGWTVANTTNGVGAPGTVTLVDIDGPGPLGTNNAATFGVGQAVFTSGVQEGVEMTQMLALVAGVSYTFDFDWAALNTNTVSNAQGGIFSLIIDGAIIASQAAGSTSATNPHYGHVSTPYVPAVSGIYAVGTRITRPFTVPATLSQHVDNFTVSAAGVYHERGDSGELLSDAEVVRGAGPLRAIVGTALTDDADMYQINICNPAAFGASTEGLADFDTQLFLFRPDGRGIAANDDSPAGSLQSRLTSLFTSGLPAGPYFLAISRYNRDPEDSGGSLIWANTPFNTERAPDGPGAANPVDHWTGTHAGGNYTIALQGACYIDPCVAVSGPIGGPSVGWPSTHGLQNTRLFRDGVEDTCVLSAPGGAPFAGSYAYDRYPFFNNYNAAVCVQVDLSTPCTGTNFIYAGAYVGGYNPATPGVNNVASLGSSPNPVASMSFTVPAHSPFEVVVSEVTPGAGCPNYVLRVSGSCPLTPPLPCYANCDGSSIPPILNVNDFICFQTRYAAGDPYANCDGSTVPPVLNINDFICFQTRYAAGCP